MASCCQHPGEGVWAPLLELLATGQGRYGFGERPIPFPCTEASDLLCTWVLEAQGASGNLTVTPDPGVPVQGTSRLGNGQAPPAAGEMWTCPKGSGIQEEDGSHHPGMGVMTWFSLVSLYSDHVLPYTPTQPRTHTYTPHLHTLCSGPAPVATLFLHLQTSPHLCLLLWSRLTYVQTLPSRDNCLSVFSSQWTIGNPSPSLINTSCKSYLYFLSFSSTMAIWILILSKITPNSELPASLLSWIFVISKSSAAFDDPFLQLQVPPFWLFPNCFFLFPQLVCPWCSSPCIRKSCSPPFSAASTRELPPSCSLKHSQDLPYQNN